MKEFRPHLLDRNRFKLNQGPLHEIGGCPQPVLKTHSVFEGALSEFFVFRPESLSVLLVSYMNSRLRNLNMNAHPNISI